MTCGIRSLLSAITTEYNDVEVAFEEVKDFSGRGASRMFWKLKPLCLSVVGCPC
jgi:hypothetical protein